MTTRILDFRTAKGRFTSLPRDPSTLIAQRVPFSVRVKLQEILNLGYRGDPLVFQCAVAALQEICPHTLIVEHERTESGPQPVSVIAGYTRICLICRDYEDAKTGILHGKRKRVFLYERLKKTQPLLVSRHIGDWTISIFHSPLEEIVAKIFEERERRKTLFKKKDN